MKNKFYLVFFSFISLFLAVSLYSAPLTQKSFENDMHYYHRLAEKDDLNANGRLYILNRIQKKYQASQVSTRQLEKEITRWEREKSEQDGDVSPVKEEEMAAEAEKTEESEAEVPSASEEVVGEPLSIEQPKKEISPFIFSSVEISTEAAEVITFPTYSIRHGDLLSIYVFPYKELSGQVIVLEDSPLDFPLLGDLEVRGKSLSKAESAIQKRISRVLPSSRVRLEIWQGGLSQAIVYGAVNYPGAINITGGLHVSKSIDRAGGITSFSDTQSVKVYSGEYMSFRSFDVNLEDILQRKSRHLDLSIGPSDRIYVPFASNSVLVLGDVSSPGRYLLRERVEVHRFLKNAGLIKEDSPFSRRVRILRKTSRRIKVIKESISEENMGPVLEVGDVLLIG